MIHVFSFTSKNERLEHDNTMLRKKIEELREQRDATIVRLNHELDNLRQRLEAEKDMHQTSREELVCVFAVSLNYFKVVF